MELFRHVYCLALTLLALLPQAMSGHAEDCPAKYRPFKGHTACLPKSPNAKSIEMTPKLKKLFLDAHNKRRATVMPPAANMMKMTWDDELEMLARRWADACEVRSGVHHDHMRFIPDGLSVGQNLHGGSLDFEAAIGSWWNAGRMYYFGESFLKFMNNNLWGIVVGHYTQMTWAKSYKLGCAVTVCGRNEVIVCNYGTAGNVVPFKRPYVNGTRCSMCHKCTDGLCDCGDKHCNGGAIDPTTCECDCQINGRVQAIYPEPVCKLKCEGTKDMWYCGRAGVTNCQAGWIVKSCPHMCKVCPT